MNFLQVIHISGCSISVPPKNNIDTLHEERVSILFSLPRSSERVDCPSVHSHVIPSLFERAVGCLRSGAHLDVLAVDFMSDEVCDLRGKLDARIETTRLNDDDVLFFSPLKGSLKNWFVHPVEVWTCVR